MLIKKALAVALLQTRGTLASPKAWVALFVGALLGATAGVDYLTVAKAFGRPFQMMEPIQTMINDRLMIFVSVICIAFLTSDAPFSDRSTPYLIFRTRRRVWLFGNALFLLMASFGYLLAVSLSSVLVSLSYAYVQNHFSPVARALASSQMVHHLTSYRFIGTLILDNMGPYKSFAAQLSYLALYAFSVCAVMLLVNTFSRRGGAGFAIAMVLHCLFLVLYMDGDPIGSVISLFSYANLCDIIAWQWPLYAPMLIYLGFSACVYGLTILLSRRIDI